VIRDLNDSVIDIGVNETITENELRSILSRVAASHQHDPARDYVFGPYLMVRAFLCRDGRRSKTSVGSLRHYVPRRDGTSETEIQDLDRMGGTRDTFVIHLEETRINLEFIEDGCSERP